MSDAARSETSLQTGDRAGFLARIRERQGPPPSTGPHPPPPVPDVVPAMRYRNLDDVAGRSSLIDLFVTTVREAAATIDVLDDGLRLADILARVVADHGVESVVVSRESEAQAAADELWALGLTVDDYTPELAATADLAITSATHGIAATGSVVVDSRTAGSRAVSLLPRVHVCLLPADRIVPTPSDVLRHPEPDGLPSCRVLITGPSRTGDIEQRLTLGAHGPVALHVVVLPG